MAEEQELRDYESSFTEEDLAPVRTAEQVQQAYAEVYGRAASEEDVARYLQAAAGNEWDYERMVRDMQTEPEFGERLQREGLGGSAARSWRIYQEGLHNRALPGGGGRDEFYLASTDEALDEKYVRVLDLGDGTTLYVDQGNAYGAFGKAFGDEFAEDALESMPRWAMKFWDVATMGSGLGGRWSGAYFGREGVRKADWNRRDLRGIQMASDTISGTAESRIASAGGWGWALGGGIAMHNEAIRQGYGESQGQRARWQPVVSRGISTVAGGVASRYGGSGLMRAGAGGATGYATGRIMGQDHNTALRNAGYAAAGSAASSAIPASYGSAVQQLPQTAIQYVRARNSGASNSQLTGIMVDYGVRTAAGYGVQQVGSGSRTSTPGAAVAPGAVAPAWYQGPQDGWSFQVLPAE
mgnify:CR=1 FL=1